MVRFPPVNPAIPSFKDWDGFCHWDDVNVLKNRKGSQLVMTTSVALAQYHRESLEKGAALLPALHISKDVSFQYVEVDPKEGEVLSSNHKRVPPASIFMGLGKDDDFCFYLLKTMHSDAIAPLWAPKDVGYENRPFVPSVTNWDLSNLGRSHVEEVPINPDIPAFKSLGEIWKKYKIPQMDYCYTNRVVITTSEALKEFYPKRDKGFASLTAMSVGDNRNLTSCSVAYSNGVVQNVKSSTTGPRCHLFKGLGGQSDARFYVLRTGLKESLPQLWASQEQVKAGLTAA